uniref:BZIP domain-containing protein n=1 Tax=Brassica campestris TaxID=3711 RepID=A0A3P6D058_BRACM|nr:unnamed protein product [Brassica rapa]
MDGHAGIPPSYSGLSQYPRANPFGDESSNRATMPPPSGSSLPPFQPCPQIPPTGQPSQYGSSPSWSTLPQPSSSLLSFPPLSPSSFLDFPSATVANKEMAYPPVPYTGGSGSSLPSSVFSVQPPYRGFPSATVANNDMALPPIAYMMPNSSSAEGSKAHKRASSDSIRLNSLMASNRIYPNPIDMPVGVRTQNESVGDKSWSHNEDVNVDAPNGNKRRAANEIAPPRRIWRSVSAGSSLNEAPSLPQGVSVDVGNDTAFGGMFTPEQLRKIASSDELKEMAASDPKRLKRRLSNRESAARSKEKKALQKFELEVKVERLETQIDTLTAVLKLEKVITILLVTRERMAERMAADHECARLRTSLDGADEQARVHHDLIEQLNGEVRRLTEEASRLREEVNEYRRRESERMNANMLEQLNINQFEETDYNFE